MTSRVNNWQKRNTKQIRIRNETYDCFMDFKRNIPIYPVDRTSHSDAIDFLIDFFFAHSSNNVAKLNEGQRPEC